jgi:hypothetical protein
LAKGGQELVPIKDIQNLTAGTVVKQSQIVFFLSCTDCGFCFNVKNNLYQSIPLVFIVGGYPPTYSHVLPTYSSISSKKCLLIFGSNSGLKWNRHKCNPLHIVKSDPCALIIELKTCQFFLLVCKQNWPSYVHMD